MAGSLAPLVIGARYNGPARSANGGYAAGSLAAALLEAVGSPEAPVEVTLRQPPPLETPLTVAVADLRGTLTLDEDVVAEARVVEEVPEAVGPVGAEQAAAAMERYPGLRNHPFPGCFACGPDRVEGDGLSIFPGPVGSDRGFVASLWVPATGAAVDVPTAWAALDCVGGWSEDLEGRPCVLGRMTAQVGSLPVAGERHVVVGRHLSTEGRKSFTAATLYDAGGRASRAPGTPGSRSTRPPSTDRSGGHRGGHRRPNGPGLTAGVRSVQLDRANPSRCPLVEARRRATRSTSAASPTATATASATCRASRSGCRTSPTSASTPSGSPRSTPRRSTTTATTSPTTATSTRCSGGSPTSTRCSRRLTGWA